MSLRSRAVAVLLVIAWVAIPAVVPASASAEDVRSCRGSVVLVHDIASSAAEWNGWTDDLDSRGWCPVVFTYGATGLTRALQPAGDVAGVASLDRSAAEIAAVIDETRTRTGESRVRVVARGAGALAVQYALARLSPDHPAVATLVTIGPMWKGTNIAGLGTIAAFNRKIGIYDALERIEKPLVAPFCAGCGQIVTGSSFLTDLRSDVPVPGVRYVDVVSAADGLVTDPTTSAMPGSETSVVQAVDHVHLSTDPTTRRLALDKLE